MSTVTVMSGGKGGREVSSPTNPKKVRSGNFKKRSAVYLSENTTGAEKRAWCMDPDTPLSSVKYLNNILKITPRSGPIKIMKPALASKKES